MIRVIRIFAVYFFLTPVTILSAQSSLTVEIINLESNKGVVMVDLMDKHEETVMGNICKIADNKCTIVFKDLRNDQYAIRYFHDENSNEKLDTNVLGIPKEGFGFSNDAFGKFGPKDFNEWLFEVSGDTKLRMTTKYL
jgi:uncharacterized protein (DUF2141 family)